MKLPVQNIPVISENAATTPEAVSLQLCGNGLFMPENIFKHTFAPSEKRVGGRELPLTRGESLPLKTNSDSNALKHF